MSLPTYVMDVLSTENRKIKVSLVDNNSLPVNPTSFPVQIAFMQHGLQPAESDWNNGTWVTAGSTYYAQIKVGPDGGLVLPETDYWVYVRVDAGDEYPVMLAGFLVMQ